MPDPICATTAPEPRTWPEPFPTATPSSPAALLDPVAELVDGVDSPRPSRPAGCESHAATSRRRSVDRAIQRLVDGSHAGFDTLIRGNTRVLGALGRLSSDTLSQRIGAAFDRAHTGLIDRVAGNHFATTRAVGRVEARVEASFREMVRNEAIGAVDRLARGIRDTDAAAVVRTLGLAEPGTAELTLAQSLGIFGEPGDEERVRGELQAMSQSVREFREHLFGNTWEPSDFPETTRRVLCRLGMSEAPEGSILEDAIEGNRPMQNAGHYGVLGAEVGHTVYEVAHVLAHPSLLTIAPALVSIGGLALGLAIHHAVEENIEARRGLARGIGL